MAKQSTQSQYFSTNTTTERNRPFAQGLYRNRFISTTASVSKPVLQGKAGALDSAAEPFPSLSKGTLNNTFSLNHSHIPDTQLQSLTKEYPDKIMFFNFKHTTKKAPAPAQNLPEITRTLEQIEQSLEASLRRTRREIADIVECNNFLFFGTLTFDPKKHPQCADYEYAKTKFINWINSQSTRRGQFPYIAIPERQNNGNLHFHLLFGQPSFKYHPTHVRGHGKTARQCYKIDSWEKNYGFADFESIQNKSATGKYIGKYITKDLFPNTGMGLVSPADVSTGVIDKNTAIFKKYGKRYFSSKGLKKPTKKYNDTLETTLTQHSLNLSTAETYENDFVTVTTFKKSAKLKTASE